MSESAPVKVYSDVPGWFTWVDRLLFDVLLDSQRDTPPATLVELGAYLGRSAVIIGDHVREGERFVVIDLFGTDPADHGSSGATAANLAENKYSYTTLDRVQFERNYRALHPTLPEVLTAPSSVVVEHVEPGSARFVHIDASHLYDHVVEDIANARTILRPDGIVVLDDYRSAHTPGVAAATWGAVLNGGLVPFAITSHKLYGTWGDPAAHRATVAAAVRAHKDLRYSAQTVAGHEIVRAHISKKPAAKPGAKPGVAPPKPAAAWRKRVPAPVKRAVRSARARLRG